MKIIKVWSVYFSATGTTKKVVSAFADAVADALRAKRAEHDFTLPAMREKAISFCKNDLVIFGVPVYAGRVPNILLPFLKTAHGNGALAVPIVLYGNRNYDDALMELKDILQANAFRIAAAATFIGEHSFSTTLAKGRPDSKDMELVSEYARRVADVVETLSDTSNSSVRVNGYPYPYRGYYQPRDRNGNPVDIRKVKPLTNAQCSNCLLCASVCPMGSICETDVSAFCGICIKCGACIKKCPNKAKYYSDEQYLYHKHELEQTLTLRLEPELFV